ncbi:MAG: GDP-mannose 4,6-dehydratase [Firmicutes bacterium]|nr:GDP-mannose 4,6-dehydratase [Bacillota bacterium]
MTVLVTGGAGFIGSHVVAGLLRAGTTVVVLDDLSTGDRSNVPPDVPLHVVDVAGDISDLVSGCAPQCIVHLAAQASAAASMDDPAADCASNILGTVNVLEAAVRAGCKRFVLASSAAVYGMPSSLPVKEDHPLCPQSFYGLSKHSAERYAMMFERARGIQTVILRYANVYGPGQGIHGEGGVVATFTSAVLGGRRPEIHGDGTQTRDFIFVEDAAEATVRAALGSSSGVMNISTGSETSIASVLERVLKTCGSSLEPAFGPRRPGDLDRSALDPSRARSVLAWEPRFSLELGLTRTVEWWSRVSRGTPS